MLRKNPIVDGKYNPLVLIDVGKAKALRCDLKLEMFGRIIQNDSTSDFSNYSTHHQAEESIEAKNEDYKNITYTLIDILSLNTFPRAYYNNLDSLYEK